MRLLFTLLPVIYLCCACTPTSSKKDVAGDSDSLLSISEAAQQIQSGPFDGHLQTATPLLLDWGFHVADTLIFTDSADFKNHWWLKNLEGPQHKLADPSYWPDKEDWKMIDHIRQHQFIKSWKYSLEVWEFHDENGASRWLEIAKNTSRVDDAKPPRYYWVEDDRLMFLMATAARDWFEHSDELIVTLRGANPVLIELFEDPIDLHTFKVNKRGANSSAMRKKSYFHQPDTIGTFFKYFWFHTYRRREDISNAFDAVTINTYIYGETITTYKDVKEALISVKGMVEDPDLGRLDLVGLTKQDMHDQFGNAKISEKNLEVYVHQKDILILSFIDDRVEWFNFLRTNLEVNNIHDIPPELHYYNERLPATDKN